MPDSSKKFSLRILVQVLCASLLVVIMTLMNGAQISEAQAQSVRPPGNAVNLDDGTEPGPPNTLGDKSDSDFWRAFRGGDPNDLRAASPDGKVLSPTGEHWRKLRTEYIAKYALYFPAGVFVLLLLFYLLRGKMRIKGGRSGKTIPRFTLNARVAHWFMAAVFILLAISGLIILMARPVLVPLLGSEFASIMASAALQGHNLFGPLFILALLWMFIKFVGGNFFQLVDFKWILKLGGFFGGHVSSSRFNFGEKTWFWMVIILGVLMSVTGLALEFPWLIGDLRLLQVSTILHGIAAVILISVAIGHIYVGTIGMEGSIDSMLKGEVDENWAREHHDLWFEEVTGRPAGESDEREDAT